MAVRSWWGVGRGRSSTRHWIRLVNLNSPFLGGGSEGGMVENRRPSAVESLGLGSYQELMGGG